MRHLVFAIALAATSVAGTSLTSGVAHAQIDPMLQSVGIYQSSWGVAPHLVGEIYRDAADPTDYAEHWVLYPNYVYPDGKNGVVTALRPGLTSYASEQDFFFRVPFKAGSRYVRVDCHDTTDRPR